MVFDPRTLFAGRLTQGNPFCLRSVHRPRNLSNTISPVLSFKTSEIHLNISKTGESSGDSESFRGASSPGLCCDRSSLSSLVLSDRYYLFKSWPRSIGTRHCAFNAFSVEGTMKNVVLKIVEIVERKVEKNA